MKAVLITGAASGMGKAAAQQFADAGWQCVLVDRDAANLQHLIEELPPPGSESHILRMADLCDATQIAEMTEGLPELDAIINNAGMSDSTRKPLAEQEPEDLERLLALNLHAPAAVIDACSVVLKPRARIVNVASGAGLHAIPWRGAYSPSKAGLIAQSKALAVARPDLCVTVLAPGFVRTELLETLIQAGRLDPVNAVSKIPLGRMGAPAEMASAMCFLASVGAQPLTGQILAVNGGSSIYGGSHRYPPSELEPVPFELPMRLETVGTRDAKWQLPTRTAHTGMHYMARLDLSPLYGRSGRLTKAVHAAATSFMSSYGDQSSLTLILPTNAAERWQDAGDIAAARMLISTLACEWGGRAMRINALEVTPDVSASELHPLLSFLCGPTSQYVTGQTLVCRTTARELK